MVRFGSAMSVTDVMRQPDSGNGNFTFTGREMLGRQNSSLCVGNWHTAAERLEDRHKRRDSARLARRQPVLRFE